MFDIELHLQAESLEWLEPLVRHLGHVEIALDYQATNGQQPTHHPVVDMIDEIERERDLEVRELRRANVRRQRSTDRKRQERAIMAQISPKAIAYGPCSTCGAPQGKPCHGPDGQGFGRKGHTHLARREAFLNQKETTTS